MRHFSKGLIFFSVVLVNSGFSSPVRGDPAELQATWDKAMIILPNPMTIARMDASYPFFKNAMLKMRASGKKYPVVVYMHGCSGSDINNRKSQFIRSMQKRGFVIIAPDSGQHSDFPSAGNSCGSNSISMRNLRRADAAYTVKRLKELSWVDQDRIYMVGFSAGALFMTDYSNPGNEFKAMVFVGSECPRGVRTNVPTLSIWGNTDPLIIQSECTGQTTYSIIVPGSHSILGFVSVAETIGRFLENPIGFSINLE